MNFDDFINPELLALIPVLYIVGSALKKSNMKDKWIPLILGVLSVGLSVIWVFATTVPKTSQEVMMAIFTAVTQGIMTAGTSVYVNQLYLQSKKNE